MEPPFSQGKVSSLAYVDTLYSQKFVDSCLRPHAFPPSVASKWQNFLDRTKKGEDLRREKWMAKRTQEIRELTLKVRQVFAPGGDFPSLRLTGERVRTP